MSDEDVAAEAKARGVTRAAVSMEKAAGLTKPLIFAIGNAPTALIALDELIKAGRLAPELVIGVPVGFVNVVESKELIIASEVPHIVARGRKGGSNVAAAIVNALLYRITR
jgi:precorrin-8X/cobalt-precorrin-8 methylmutase